MTQEYLENERGLTTLDPGSAVALTNPNVHTRLFSRFVSQNSLRL